MSANTAFKLYITITYQGTDAPAPHKTIRRFSAKAGTTLAEFRAILIEEILRRPDGSVAIAVSYKDADGDVVEVMSELEWAEALQQHSGAVAAGTAIPILIDVSMTGSQSSSNLVSTPSITTTSVPSNAHFSPIIQSEDDTDEDSHLFEATDSKESQDGAEATAQASVAATEVLPTESPIANTAALAESHPSTDALVMVDEVTPSDWEEVEAVPLSENIRGSQVEGTALGVPVPPTAVDEVAAEPTEASSLASTEVVQESQAEQPQQPISQGEQRAESQSHRQDAPQQPEQQAQQQQQLPQQEQPYRQRGAPFSFLAAPFAWLGHQAHQQLAAHPRGTNNRYPRYAAEAPANATDRARFTANTARYQKMTGATKSEDIAQLLSLCPAATAEQAQAALEKYNGQVYRAANYLLDTTTTTTAAAPASPQQ